MLAELASFSGVDSDFTAFDDYSINTSEFDYFGAQLSDSYCSSIQSTASPPATSPNSISSTSPFLPDSLLQPSPTDLLPTDCSLLKTNLNSYNCDASFVDTSSHIFNKPCPYLDKNSISYDNGFANLNNTSPMSYEDDIKSDDLEYDNIVYDEVFGSDTMSYSSPTNNTQTSISELRSPNLSICSDFSSGECSSPQSNLIFDEGASILDSIQLSPLSDDAYLGKGKVSNMQRSALDSIFEVTTRPSRELVLHISSELSLHHVTVKNFFSNARRRVRRAAARLSDPEKSRRENRKRKEKRRLAALAAAAAAVAKGFVVADGLVVSGTKPQPGEGIQKDQPIISPQRKALMEKLANKVHRSAAQKNLGSLPDFPSNSNMTSTTKSGITFSIGNNNFVSNLPPVSKISTTSMCTDTSLTPEVLLNSWPSSLLNDSLDFQCPESWDLGMGSLFNAA